MCMVIRWFATSLVICVFADTYGDGGDGDGGACEAPHHHLHGPEREMTARFGTTGISDMCSNFCVAISMQFAS